MTDPESADAIYIEPIQWQAVERIIEKERPDALLPTMGGQTALNCALDLDREGVLKRYNVEMIAASRTAIDMAEDRDQFRVAMGEIGLESPRAHMAHSMDEAWVAQEDIGFPIIIRPSFTMGGSGGGIAYNREEFETMSPGPRPIADDGSPAGRVRHWLERVRDGSRAGPQRQLHHHLFHRERGRDGGAYWRLHYRRPGADLDG